MYIAAIQGVLIKGNRDKQAHFSGTWQAILGIICLEGYLLFPTVPKNVGSVMLVNENEHEKQVDNLTSYQNVEVKIDAF